MVQYWHYYNSYIDNNYGYYYWGVTYVPYAWYGPITGKPSNVITDTTYTFVLDAYNGLGGITPGTFSYTVIHTNMSPVWYTGTGLLGSSYENSVISLQLNAADPEGASVTYSLTSGTLSSGLTLSPSGLIYGTLSPAWLSVMSTFTITATDPLGAGTPNTFEYQVLHTNLPPVWESTGNAGIAYMGTNVTLSQAIATDPEGNGVYYSLVGGALPPGLTMGTCVGYQYNWYYTGYWNYTPLYFAGPISGKTPIVLSDTTYSFTLNAFDGAGGVTQASFSYVVEHYNRPPVWNTPAGLLGSANEHFTINHVQLSATSLDGFTISYSVTSGTIPSGLAVSPSGLLHGVLNGVSLTSTYNFTVTASDNNGDTAPQTFSYVVWHNNLPPVWSTISGPVGSANMGTYVNLTSLYATDPDNFSISYALTSGTLPVGLTMGTCVGYSFQTVNGVQSYVPTYFTGPISGVLGGVAVNTTYSFVLTAYNTLMTPAPSGTFSYTIQHVNRPPVWVTPTGYLGSAAERTAINPIALSATDPDYNTVTYSLTSGTLPTGLALTPTGTIFGALSQLMANTMFYFTVTASDGLGGNTPNNFNYQVTHANLPPYWNTPAGIIGSSRGGNAISSIQLSATDPEGSAIVYQWTSGTLPAGLALNTNGVVYGTPTVAYYDTSYTFGVTAYDNFWASVTRTFSYTIQHSNVSPIWTSSPGLLGSGISLSTITPVQLAATSPNNYTISYAVTSGSLSAGLTLSSSGLLYGTLGNVIINTLSTFTISASDGHGDSAAQVFSYQVNHLNLPPAWSTSSGLLGSSAMLSTLTVQLVASDPQHDALTYSIASGNLPAGLLFNPSGLIFGVASVVLADTTSTFVVTAANAFGGVIAATFSYTITWVNRPPVWVTGSNLGYSYEGFSIAPIQLIAINQNSSS
jgi:hypothetical protein